MERLNFTYPGPRSGRAARARGVVGSGDLEVLLEPSADADAHVAVTTSVDGFGTVWRHVLDRFFTRFDAAAAIEINDFGATPGVVLLRLEQAAEALRA